MSSHDWVKIREKDFNALVYLAFKYGLHYKCIECEDKKICRPNQPLYCKKQIDRDVLNKVVQICVSSKVIE